MRKLLWSFILIFTGLAAWYFWYPSVMSDRDQTVISNQNDHKDTQASRAQLHDQIEDEDESVASELEEPAESSAENDMRGRLANLSDSATMNEIVEAIGVSQKEIIEARAWSQERGLSPESSGYKHYDNKTLQAMAENGDMYAQQKLGERLIDQREFDQAERLLRKAAINGSVYALDLLAYNATNRMIDTKDDNRARKHLQEALAWTDLATRRGLNRVRLGGYFREASIQRHMERLELDLTDEDREKFPNNLKSGTNLWSYSVGIWEWMILTIQYRHFLPRCSGQSRLWKI
ncbi:hypothetical protein [Marinimicrobium sp. LS-A18]|uniref:hypothetical protein n=1 Tax=Marinimicrobium sp. LS-A18 TaxID=1381596 RepID=UPI0004630E24|nr:hypothetical protein [Marinimicrobium sp. LS-A18]